jgi:hypothetical protein
LRDRLWRSLITRLACWTQPERCDGEAMSKSRVFRVFDATSHDVFSDEINRVLREENDAKIVSSGTIIDRYGSLYYWAHMEYTIDES